MLFEGQKKFSGCPIFRGVVRISSRSGPNAQGPKITPSKSKKPSGWIQYFLEGAQINRKIFINKNIRTEGVSSPWALLDRPTNSFIESPVGFEGGLRARRSDEGSSDRHRPLQRMRAS